MLNKLAAQLYTLRRELRQDFPAVLRKLKAMGWKAVQIDGLQGFPVEEIAAVMKETGLATAGMHVGLPRMMHETDAVFREAELLNARDLICHSLPDEQQHEEGYRQARRDLLDFCTKAEGRGYRVGYHNHDFEFKTDIDGKPALEHILGASREGTIYPEFDTYWVKKGGRDPLQFIEPYAGRVKILHLKDMSADDENYCEIGMGTIDFGPILVWGLQTGVEWFAVEQDECPGSPYDSLALSLANLTKLSAKLGLSERP